MLARSPDATHAVDSAELDVARARASVLEFERDEARGRAVALAIEFRLALQQGLCAAPSTGASPSPCVRSAALAALPEGAVAAALREEAMEAVDSQRSSSAVAAECVATLAPERERDALIEALRTSVAELQGERDALQADLDASAHGRSTASGPVRAPMRAPASAPASAAMRAADAPTAATLVLARERNALKAKVQKLKAENKLLRSGGGGSNTSRSTRDKAAAATPRSAAAAAAAVPLFAAPSFAASSANARARLAAVQQERDALRTMFDDVALPDEDVASLCARLARFGRARAAAAGRRFPLRAHTKPWCGAFDSFPCCHCTDPTSQYCCLPSSPSNFMVRKGKRWHAASGTHRFAHEM